MTALMLPQTESDTATGDSNEIHLECCRVDVGLCGLLLTGDYDDEADDDEVCEVCFNKDQLGQTCGAAFCRLRQAWRRWRSR